MNKRISIIIAFITICTVESIKTSNVTIAIPHGSKLTNFYINTDHGVSYLAGIPQLNSILSKGTPGASIILNSFEGNNYDLEWQYLYNTQEIYTYCPKLTTPTKPYYTYTIYYSVDNKPIQQMPVTTSQNIVFQIPPIISFPNPPTINMNSNPLTSMTFETLSTPAHSSVSTYDPSKYQPQFLPAIQGTLQKKTAVTLTATTTFSAQANLLYLTATNINGSPQLIIDLRAYPLPLTVCINGQGTYVGLNPAINRPFTFTINP